MAAPAPLPDLALREAFEALRARELAWLRRLPAAQQRLLCCAGGVPTGRAFPAHAVTHAGEIALALAGVKPCVLLMLGWPTGAAGEPSFGAALTAAVLAPWLRDFQLARAGFSLHEVATASVPPGCWLLLAERHADAPLARATFLASPAADSKAQIGRALGYPGSLRADSAFVFFMAQDETPYCTKTADGAPQELTWQAGVPLLEFVAAPHEAAAVGRHFRIAADALQRTLGLAIALDTHDCSAWRSAACVASCWRAAFGGREGTCAALDAGELVRCEWMTEGVFLKAVLAHMQT
jgi:hypothetical protein